MKTFIRVTNHCGSDWHDTSATTKFLKQHDAYEITDPNSVIFNYIKETFMDFSDKCFENMDVEKVATDKAIRESIMNRQGHLTLYRADPKGSHKSSFGYETEVVFDAEQLIIENDCMGGQVTDKYYIDILEIEDVNVRYMVVENFLCPNKGVECIERFYDFPVKTQEEAEKLYNEMQLHTRGHNVWAESVKELFVVDIDKVTKESWYALNVLAINNTELCKEFHKSHPGLNSSIPFFMYVEKHIESLKEKYEKSWKEYTDSELIF